jgi:outer membrane protein OmpA-like peptidoglycan-associated protein
VRLRPFALAARVPLLLSLVLSAAVAIPAHAVEERAWISLEASGAFYDPEQALRDTPGFGGRAAGFLNRWAGIEVLAHRSSPDLESPAAGGATFTHYGAGVILTPDRYRWTLPYVVGGFGSATLDREPDAGASTSESQSAIHFGGGIIVRIGERLGFRLDGRDVTYKQEGNPGRATRVHTFLVSGGVTAFFAGRSRDTDVDGIPDKRDRCPETPSGAVVDASGCPLDTDGDKVFDGLDKCAGTPKGAIVDETGCPLDQDRDGVADGIDQCDSTAAGVVVDARGCGVDSDKDGVYDGPDQCPATPEGAVVDARGCPVDSDQDGVADGIDICPATPAGAAVNAGGCPLTPTPYERTMLQDWIIRLTDLAFVPDSSRLLPEGMARLDSVAAVMRQWPMLRWEIGVHVDDQPPPAYRVPLSSQRSQAVARYILQTSPTLDPKSFSLTGYGDTEPLVRNSSSANRARNRRVEFKVQNPNVLSEERGRRSSFGTTPVPAKEPETPPPPPDGGEE